VRDQPFGKNCTGEHVALKSQLVTVNAEAALCDNATGVVDQSINVVKALREFVGEGSDIIEAIKITDKWCRPDVRCHRLRSLRVSAHHGNSP
jgi:hypothetical protein